MKITALTTFIVPPRWLFLKIETDEGITGWGEPIVEGRADTVAAAVAELGEYLIGKDPRPIEDHWTVLYRGGFYRGGAIHMSALAGIDPTATLAVGDKDVLAPTLDGTDVRATSNYTSSDASIVRVSTNGVRTAVTAGTATITVTHPGAAAPVEQTATVA